MRPSSGGSSRMSKWFLPAIALLAISMATPASGTACGISCWLSCCAGADGAGLPQGWRLLNRDGLSIAAPADTTLESSDGIDAHGWRLHNPRLVISIQRGPFIADGDDSEPNRCYDQTPIVVDGRRTVLRTGKGFPRLDCPEKYASLYIRAEPPAGRLRAVPDPGHCHAGQDEEIRFTGWLGLLRAL